MGMRTRRTLEVSANLLILVFGLVGAYSYVSKYLDQHRMYLHAGDRAPALDGFSWAAHKRNVLLVLSDGCEYCEKSAPFYRRLATLQGTKDGFSLSAMVPQGKAVANSMLARLGLNVPIAAGAKFVKIRGTPTVFLINEHGYIEKVWMGALSKQGEEDVLKALSM